MYSIELYPSFLFVFNVSPHLQVTNCFHKKVSLIIFLCKTTITNNTEKQHSHEKVTEFWQATPFFLAFFPWRIILSYMLIFPGISSVDFSFGNTAWKCYENVTTPCNLCLLGWKLFLVIITQTIRRTKQNQKKYHPIP